MLEYLWHYALTVLQIIVYMYFANLFFKKGKVVRIVTTALLVALPIPFINSLENMLLNFLSAYLAVFAALFIIHREKLPRTAAMALVVCVLNFLCESITLFFSVVILDGYTKSIITQNIFSVIYAFITLLVFFVITYVVKIIITKQQANTPFVFVENFRVVLLPVMTIAVGYYIMYAGEDHPDETLSIIGLLIFLLLITVDISVLLGTESDMKRYELKANLEAMRLQEEYNTETIRQLENSQKELAKQGHDFKNHLFTVDAMIQSHRTQADLDAADNYVRGLLHGIDEAQSAGNLNIKNTALRAMVNRLESRCGELGIELDIDIQYSDFSFMRFQDICSLFANAFDNALWACRQIDAESTLHKSITVSIQKKHDTVRVKIANTCATPIAKKKWRFISQKDTTGRTGVGTQNMKRSVERYGGTIEWNQSGDWLSVTAMLSAVQPSEPNIR